MPRHVVFVVVVVGLCAGAALAPTPQVGFVDTGRYNDAKWWGAVVVDTE
eukprot:gene40272-58970_t